MRRTLITLIFTAASTGVAAAQTPPQEVTVVDELVVRAYDGPAWWTVSDADTKIYILAVQGAVPKGTHWDRTQLQRRLTGAKKLILPGRPKTPVPSPADLWKILRYKRGMDRGEPVLEGTLPAPLATRFAKVRASIGQGEQRYGTLPTGAAAMMLAGDVYQRWYPPRPPPPTDNIEAAIEAEARARRVPRERPAYTGPKFGYNVMLSDLAATGPACLDAIVAALEKGKPSQLGDPQRSFEIAAAAWAEGDIRPMLRNAQLAETVTPEMLVNAQGYVLWIPRGAWTTCTREMPNVQKDLSRANMVADTTTALRRQLRQPGHAVAVVHPLHLLRRDGVLDRLRREGFTVTAPGG